MLKIVFEVVAAIVSKVRGFSSEETILASILVKCFANSFILYFHRETVAQKITGEHMNQLIIYTTQVRMYEQLYATEVCLLFFARDRRSLNLTSTRILMELFARDQLQLLLSVRDISMFSLCTCRSQCFCYYAKSIMFCYLKTSHHFI